MTIKKISDKSASPVPSVMTGNEGIISELMLSIKNEMSTFGRKTARQSTDDKICKV